MEKTRLNSGNHHGIGVHRIDVAAEVGVEVVGLLTVVVVLTGHVMNGKERVQTSKVGHGGQLRSEQSAPAQ